MEADWHRFAFLGSTSMPLESRDGTGDGSLMATLISSGVVVSRYTPEGTIIPFGQDIGTADDATAVSKAFPDDDSETASLSA